MNYQNGKIYKLVSNNTDKIYIGSTCSSLSKRLNQHKREYKCSENGNRKYLSKSKDVLCFGDVDIILLENSACNNKNELHARERYFIENNVCVNKCIPNRNLNEKKDLAYNYRLNNKLAIKERNLNYRINNIEKIKANKKITYEKNKVDILNKQKEIIVCECGANISKGNKPKHLNTNKHNKLIQSLNLT